MKRKKSLGIVLPVLTGLTLIGTGFSVWYFTDTTNNVELAAKVNLHGYAQIGSLKISGEETAPNNVFLDFDSTAHNGGGINLKKGADASSAELYNDINLTYAYSQDSQHASGVNPEVTYVPHIKMELTIAGASGEEKGLDDYVTVALVADGSGQVAPSGTSWTSTTTDDTGTKYVYEADLALPTSLASPITISMPDFQFSYSAAGQGEATNEPTDPESWAALNSVISNLTDSTALTIDYTLAWSENSSN